MLKRILPALICCLVSCARVTDAGKILAGTSTRALQEAPAQYRHKKTFPAEYPIVYREVLKILKAKNCLAFLRSERKRRIVAMNLLDATDTTEIGIFFTPVNEKETEVEIVCLSPGHLKLAKQLIFSELERRSNEATTYGTE